MLRVEDEECRGGLNMGMGRLWVPVLDDAVDVDVERGESR